jgi:hypothetical protein
MDTVILTIKSFEGKQLMDLEVPFDITSEELAQSLASYMQLPNVKGLWVDSLKRKLYKGESLKDAGVWEGSFITIDPTD